MQTQPLSIGWRMRRTDETDWIPATVPGSVYGDLLAVGKMQDPFWKDNEDDALERMDYDYEYCLSFPCDLVVMASEEVLLRFDGLDTIADITLNGNSLGHADNMHRVWEYRVKEYLRERDNTLSVIFRSPHEIHR